MTDSSLTVSRLSDRIVPVEPTASPVQATLALAGLCATLLAAAVALAAVSMALPIALLLQRVVGPRPVTGRVGWQAVPA